MKMQEVVFPFAAVLMSKTCEVLFDVDARPIESASSGVVLRV
jgi:hypothetical protein